MATHVQTTRWLLVTTTQAVLALDVTSGQLRQVHWGSGLYFGIATYDDLILVGCRDSTEGPVDTQRRALENGFIGVLDRSLMLVDRLRPTDFSLRDLHGIAVFDNKLWITCSRDNMVAICDLRERSWSRWYPSPDPVHRGEDIHHFNTVCCRDGQVWLVAHEWGASHLFRFSYPELELQSVTQLGWMAHDLFDLIGSVATCSSGEGQLVNLAGHRIVTGEFPRGYAAMEGNHFVGISMTAEPEHRSQANGLIRRFDQRWAHVRDYSLPSVGMVLSMIPMPVEHSSVPASLPIWPAAGQGVADTEGQAQDCPANGGSGTTQSK